MDRRGFFKSMLGKGLSHGARQVDAVVIPFERAARAARDAMPQEQDHEPPPFVPEVREDDETAAPVAAKVLSPLPAVAATGEVAEEDLMRLTADAGLILHVEEVVELAHRTLRIVPGDRSAAPGSRSRLGGAPDLPAGAAWPTWDDEPLTFLAQIDLVEATALGVELLLPARGVLLIFSALDRTPSGSSPLDRDSTRLLYVEPERLPVEPPAPVGRSKPYRARTLELSGELVLPPARSTEVRALDLDADQRLAYEQVRRELAELQGVEAWEDGEPLQSRHHLLGIADEARGDMPLACELAARGIDVGYGAPAAHPEAVRVADAAVRWRLLLQLSVDDEAGWSFGDGRERLYVWAPEEEAATAVFPHLHALAR